MSVKKFYKVDLTSVKSKSLLQQPLCSFPSATAVHIILVRLSWEGEPFTPTHHHLLVELTLFSGRGKLNFVELVQHHHCCPFLVIYSQKAMVTQTRAPPAPLPFLHLSLHTQNSGKRWLQRSSNFGYQDNGCRLQGINDNPQPFTTILNPPPYPPPVCGQLQ